MDFSGFPLEGRFGLDRPGESEILFITIPGRVMFPDLYGWSNRDLKHSGVQGRAKKTTEQ